MRLAAVFALWFLNALSGAAAAQESVRIMTWNAQTTLYESLPERNLEFQQLVIDYDPDVLVLVEVAGTEEAKAIADALGWTDYQAVVSDFSLARDQAFQGLELLVISKLPIERVIEFDVSLDQVQPAFGKGSLGSTLPTVTEKELVNTALPSLAPFHASTRGTLQVDLDNGLTLYPVHLKSNRNGACFAIEGAIEEISSQDLEAAATLQRHYDNGFRAATKERVDNAIKRERVMANVALLANQAGTEGRTPVILGDFNTSFEKGLFGESFRDCTLKDFSCEQAPFPRSACKQSGYDDTLGMLTKPLIGEDRWRFLSRDLGRTYVKEHFADKAIDHIAVRDEDKGSFSTAEKTKGAYGSDHFAVFTDYTGP